jgi:hypothetical protein
VEVADEAQVSLPQLQPDATVVLVRPRAHHGLVPAEPVGRRHLREVGPAGVQVRVRVVLRGPERRIVVEEVVEEDEDAAEMVA